MKRIGICIAVSLLMGFFVGAQETFSPDDLFTDQVEIVARLPESEYEIPRGDWAVQEDTRTGEIGILHRPTGEISPLPDGIEAHFSPDLCQQLYQINYSAISFSVSSDQQWLVFRDCHTINYSVYAYHTATRQILILGQIIDNAPYSWFEVLDWTGDNQAIIQVLNSVGSISLSDCIQRGPLQIASHF